MMVIKEKLVNPNAQQKSEEQIKCYQAPQIILELELEAQAGSSLSLPDLGEGMGEEAP